MHRRWNSFVKEFCYEATVSLSLGQGRDKTCMIQRLVYQAFVKEIDFDSDGLKIWLSQGSAGSIPALGT